MELGELIRHKMRYIFREKSYTKYRGETIHRTFQIIKI